MPYGIKSLDPTEEDILFIVNSYVNRGLTVAQVTSNLNNKYSLTKISKTISDLGLTRSKSEALKILYKLNPKLKEDKRSLLNKIREDPFHKHKMSKMMTDINKKIWDDPNHRIRMKEVSSSNGTKSLRRTHKFQYSESHLGMTPTEWSLHCHLKLQLPSEIFLPQCPIFQKKESISVGKLDFYHKESNTDIELDGWNHFEEKDRLRDEFLSTKYGAKVIRFNNEEIIRDINLVIRIIKNKLRL